MNDNVVLTSGIMIDKKAVDFNIKKIINQVYKLLPMRQEKRDWLKPLETLIEEIEGMKQLIIGQDDLFFLLLCKMKGLFSLQDQEDMTLYRRIIFQCLSLLNSLRKNVGN